MEPIAEVTAAVVRMVHGRVGREEGCRPARSSLAVVVKAPRRLGTCGKRGRSRVFKGWRLPPCRVVVDVALPFGGLPLSRDLPLSRRVLLCLQPEGGQLDL